MLIFSYGSNMSLERITGRVPSAKKVCNAYKQGYKLILNKKSKDGSVKANIQESNGDIIHGIIFEILDTEKKLLDKAEGLGYGYNEEIMTFIDADGYELDAQVYIADSEYITEGLSFDWYLDFILNGAIENQLPPNYINYIKGFKDEGCF